MAWIIDEETGQRKISRGVEVPRPPGTMPPCVKCAKCQGRPYGEQRPAVGRLSELSRKNRRTLWAYYEHEACGGQITDPITRRNFGTIRWLIDKLGRDVSTAALARG